MRIEKFEDIYSWQKAQDLAVDIYSIFNNSRDFGFKSQICRATVSVSNNIAEGFDRKGNKEFARFLWIAKGSCSEVRSMLYLAYRIGYVNIEQQNSLIKRCDEISRLIQGLLNSMK